MGKSSAMNIVKDAVLNCETLLKKDKTHETKLSNDKNKI